MPRYSKRANKKRNNKSLRKRNNKKGGGIIKAPTCAQQVDITRYTRPCSTQNELPLDNIFMKHFPQQGGKSKSKQSAGGFSILPDTNIGNLPEIRGYSDCCPPVYTKNGPVWSNNFQPVCGQKGGKTSRSSRSNRRLRKQRKIRTKRGGSRTLSKKSKKSRSKRRLRRKHRGGSMAGMDGANGNFSADMTTRQFGCRQPYWTPDCV